MKIIFFLLYILNFSNAEYIKYDPWVYPESFDIKCKGAIKESNMWDLPSNTIGTSSFVDGHLFSSTAYWGFYLSSSPACGGNGTKNKLVMYSTNSVSNLELGNTSGFQVYNYDSDKDLYYNQVIFVNSLPCVSPSFVDLTLPIYKIDTENYHEQTNMGFSTVRGFTEVLDYPYNTTYNLTDNEIKYQRTQCSNNPYDELEPQALEQNNLFKENKSLINNLELSMDNTNQIYQNILSAINNLSSSDNTPNTDNTIETSLLNINNTDLSTNETMQNDKMTSFKTNYTNILNTSFINYSDVFGFGGYGSAPETISFNLLGQSYDVFNANNFDPFIDTFRNTFASFAYLWGFLIVIKDFKS